MDNVETCPSCGYEANTMRWTRIGLHSDGYSALVCVKYSEDKGHEHLGSVELISCPKCKTVLWRR